MRLDRSDLELEVIIRRIAAGEIDLQPDFQRGEVWNDERQLRLVDSVLRGWYIPPVHVIREPGTSFDLILDGQQRLRSLRRFFADELRIGGHFPPDDPQIMALHGLSYSELPAEAQRRVRRFPLTVITLSDHAPEEPYELFFRLNQHVALTPPEKRNALYGAARDQIKSIVTHLTETQRLDRSTVGFANSRLAYDDVFARVAFAFQSRTLGIRFSNDALEDFYRRQSFSPDVVKRCIAAADEFLKYASRATPRLNKATFFSWLVFSDSLLRVRKPLDQAFVSDFEGARMAAKTHHGNGRAPPYFSVYNDRASYRVNDTLSVRIRDLVLNLAYADWRPPGLRDDLPKLLTELSSASANVEPLLAEFIEAVDWDIPQ